MSRELLVRNRQRVRRIHTPLLRRIARALLDDLVGAEQYELCLHLVAAPKMARVNEQFLAHAGPTDVITFDHSLGVPPSGDPEPRKSGGTSPARLKAGTRTLHGEIFICFDDAVAQARAFRTSWQSEVIRYFVHGVLHLLGHDDLKPPARRRMKREENRLLRQLETRFPLNQLAARAVSGRES